MSEFYKYITDQGIIVPDTSTLLSDIQEEFRDLFGDNLDTAPETPQGRLIELFNRNRGFCIKMCAAVSNMLNLNKANGFVLDDLGALFLISRKPATYTNTTVILSGVPGTIIPANTRLQTVDGDIFVNDVIYTIGSSGSVQAKYRSEKTGSIPCPADTLTKILDVINGLETATNPGNPTLGTELESDSLFRNRIRDSLNVNSIAILSAIKSNLESIDGVQGSYCYDNYGGSATVVGGISVPAHSLLAVVDGGDEQAIANVLFAKKTLGTGYIGKTATGYTIVEKTVVDEAYGTSYIVRFARPLYVDVNIQISVNRKNYSGKDLQQAIKDSIVNFALGGNPEVDGVSIGTPLSPFEISAAVSADIPEIFISDVQVGRRGESLQTSTLAMSSTEKANILASNITVNITE